MSYKSGIINNLISNTLEITFPDEDCETITEANIVSESMKLKQAISDGDELCFGGCIASEFTIDILKTYDAENDAVFPDVDLKGKWIAVKLTQTYADPEAPMYPSSTLYPSGNVYPGKTVGNKEFWIFSGYIDSAKVNKNDKNVITVTAYDALALLHEADATDFLYSFFKTREGTYNIWLLLQRALSVTYNHTVDVNYTGLATIFGERYTDLYGDTQVGSFNPYNEYWLSRKDKITFGAVIKSICEMLAVFGIIVPNSGKGSFTFKCLSESAETYDFYEALETEDYQATGYTDFQFSLSDGNESRPGKSILGGGLTDASAGAADKIYDFSENVMVLMPYTTSVQGRMPTEFDVLINRTSIGTRLALNAESTAHPGQCAFSSYTPLTATLDGRPWVSVGSPIEILVNKTTLDGSYVYDENDEIVKESVKTYVLSRTLTGIQALTDEIEVKGVR